MSIFQLLTTCKLSLGHNCSSVHSPSQAHFVAHRRISLLQRSTESCLRGNRSESLLVRKAVFSAWPKNVCYRSWWRETKPHPNESATPTLNTLRVDRAPALRGVGLCAVAHGAWGLGAVTPGRQYRSATRRQGSIGLAQC